MSIRDFTKRSLTNIRHKLPSMSIIGNLGSAEGIPHPIDIADLMTRTINTAKQQGLGSPSIQTLLDTIGTTRGSILYRGASGWALRVPNTAGFILTDGGVGADPTWVAPGAGAGEPSLGDFLTVPASPGFDPNMIYNSSIVLSGSNKTATPVSSSPYNYAYGTTARYTGKRYFEFVPGSTSFESVGITGSGGHMVDLDAGSPGNFGTRLPGNIGYQSDGTVIACPYTGGGAVTLATYATWIATDRLSFAVNIDKRLFWVRVNAGNWNNNASANPATDTLGLFVPMLFSNASNMLVWPGCNMGNTSASSLYLLGADFTESVPSGYSAWAA